MKICKHKKVVFAGVQETLDPDTPLLLFRCLSCSSTVALNTYSDFEISFSSSTPKINVKRQKTAP